MTTNDIRAAFEEAHLDMRFCYDKDNQGQYLDPRVKDKLRSVKEHYFSFLAGIVYAQSKIDEEALAQPEQEPEQERIDFDLLKDWCREMLPMTVIGQPDWWVKRIYDSFIQTSTPQRKPLHSSEIVTMYAECPTSDKDMVDFARAIEAAHGIKE